MTAIRSAPATFRGIPDLAHAPVEKLHRLQQLLALGLPAYDAIFASEKRYIEREREVIHRSVRRLGKLLQQ